ncbi:unnamed protein product, partial [Hapterophycus canaliculatus]
VARVPPTTCGQRDTYQQINIYIYVCIYGDGCGRARMNGAGFKQGRLPQRSGLGSVGHPDLLLDRQENKDRSSCSLIEEQWATLLRIATPRLVKQLRVLLVSLKCSSTRTTNALSMIAVNSVPEHGRVGAKSSILNETNYEEG